MYVVGFNGSLLNELYSPRGLARDPNTGTLYIADMNNHRVVSYASGATIGVLVAGGNGAGTLLTQLHTPTGLYLDISTNSLYISNLLGYSIVRWVIGATTSILVAGNPNGASGTATTALYGPSNLNFDSAGNMYVSDTYSHRIQFFLAGQPNATTIAGVTSRYGSASYLLYNPFAVALDSDFNLYVADTTNQRIQKFQRY